MRITLIDDSIAFDGATPATAPLDGAQRAVAGLATALARRGHAVAVLNRCMAASTHEGVTWRPLQQDDTMDTDVAIAFWRPSLVERGPPAARRVLWLSTPSLETQTPAVRALAERLGVVVAGTGGGYRRIIAPASGAPFIKDAEPDAHAPPPRAVTTAHPLRGLAWLIEVWRGHIRPRLPDAELHVYSALLTRALDRGDAVPEVLAVLEKVRAGEEDGVVLCAPEGEAGMAEAYRKARVMLYPGHERDLACWTLADAQACGLPVVARARGGVRERLTDAETGFVTPDDAAFANVALRVMEDETLRRNLGFQARKTRRRNWDQAAAEFEALWT